MIIANNQLSHVNPEGVTFCEEPFYPSNATPSGLGSYNIIVAIIISPLRG